MKIILSLVVFVFSFSSFASSFDFFAQCDQRLEKVMTGKRKVSDTFVFSEKGLPGFYVYFTHQESPQPKFYSYGESLKERSWKVKVPEHSMIEVRLLNDGLFEVNEDPANDRLEQLVQLEASERKEANDEFRKYFTYSLNQKIGEFAQRLQERGRREKLKGSDKERAFAALGFCKNIRELDAQVIERERAAVEKYFNIGR